MMINPLNAICHLLALLGAHHILHVSRIRVKKEVYDTVDETMGTHTVCRHGAIMAVANMFV
jgi:hypothetical protein